MPKSQIRFDQHRLFQVEKRGDTLVVTPQGDPAGFANLNFSQEHSSILEVLSAAKFQNVLVDLSRSNYFGAKILGAFTEWSEKVEANGGQFALCGLSSDMKELLVIFQLEGRWREFPTLESGIKEIVTESTLDKARANWKPLSQLVCTVAVLSLLTIPSTPYFENRVYQSEYDQILLVWDEMLQMKESNASPAEWRKFQREADRQLVPLLRKLNKRKGGHKRHGRIAVYFSNALEQNIINHLLAAQDRLSYETPTGPEYERYWLIATFQINRAKCLINGEDPKTVPVPDLADFPSSDPEFEPEIVPHGEPGAEPREEPEGEPRGEEPKRPEPRGEPEGDPRGEEPKRPEPPSKRKTLPVPPAVAESYHET